MEEEAVMSLGGGDLDRSSLATLDLLPRNNVSIGVRCGGVGGGLCVGPSSVLAEIIESSVMIKSLMGVGTVVPRWMKN